MSKTFKQKGICGVIGFVLMFAMMLSVFAGLGSITVHAEEPNDDSIYGTEENPVVVTTYEQLMELYNDTEHSTYIKLGKDITQIITNESEVLKPSNSGFDGYNKSIDLNGKRLFFINDSSCLQPIKYKGFGTLEIKDSVGGGKIEAQKSIHTVSVSGNGDNMGNFILRSGTIIGDDMLKNGVLHIDHSNYALLGGSVRNIKPSAALHVATDSKGIIDNVIIDECTFEGCSQNTILGGSLGTIYLSYNMSMRNFQYEIMHPTVYIYGGNMKSVYVSCDYNVPNGEQIYGGGDVYIYGGFFQDNDFNILQNPFGKTRIAGGTFTLNADSGAAQMIEAKDLEFASGAVVKLDGVTLNNPTTNSFPITVGQTKTITVTNDKLIKEFSINDTLNVGDTIAGTLTTANAGIKSIKATWSREGISQYEGKEVRYGNYTATIKITANEGYTLTNATKVTAFGKTLQGFTDGVNIAEDGSTLTLKLSLYVDCVHHYEQKADADVHWTECSICHDKTDAVDHSFGAKVVDGSYDKYTCTDCGYVKQIANTREMIVQVKLIDTPAVEGNTFGEMRLGFDALGNNGNDQMTVSELKWYKGSVSPANEVASGGTFEAGNTYYAVMTLTAKGNYYFNYDNEGNVGKAVSMSYSGGYNNDSNLSESESVLKTTIRYDIVERQNVVITLPDLVFGKTVGDIAEETKVTMNGVEVGFSIHLKTTVGGISNNIDITYNADTNAYSSINNDIVTTQATKLIAKQDYTISIFVDNDEKYVVASDITVVNGEGLEYNVIGDSAIFVGFGDGCFTTGDGCVDNIELNGITAPAYGEMPSNEYEIGNGIGVAKHSFTWNTVSAFQCGEVYSITAVVKTANDHWFSAYWTMASVDIPNATVKTVVNDENTATVTITFDALAHDYTLRHNDTHHWYECDNCNDKTTEVEHDGNATCLERAHCSVCDIDYGMALGHDLENDAAVPATCTEPGTEAGKHCSRCDYTEGGASVAALGHDFAGGTEYSKDEDGHAKKCSRCNAYDTVSAHNYGGDNICDDCGYDKTVPHIHAYTEENATPEFLKTPATCTEKAVYYKSCECGLAGTETFESGEPLGHDFVNGNVYQKDENGHAKKCSRCDAYDTVSAHNYGGDNICDDCGYDKTVPHTHAYTEENATPEFLKTPANCTDKAVYYKSCSCGAKGTATFESGDALGHDYHEVANSAVSATCTANGKQADEKCSRCDDVKTGATINALGHNYGEDHICDLCGHEQTVTPDPTDNPSEPVTEPEKEGLSAGAIVGIAVGGTAVAGCGGFALVWFVIKKKSWADFLMIFKKK